VAVKTNAKTNKLAQKQRRYIENLAVKV